MIYVYIYISSLIIYKNDEISHTGMVDARFPSEKSPSFFHLLPQASWASNLVWVSQHLERLETTKWRHCFGVKDIYIYIYIFFLKRTIILCEIFNDSNNSVVWWDV